MNRDINCGECGVLLKDAHWKRKFCKECGIKRDRDGARSGGKSGAYAVMNCAIRHGFLKPAKEHSCVDCGAQAEHYDHRDYNRPLDVEPVCACCNAQRGKAIPRRAE
jgi:hypothetical protein